jgi:peptidoglycan/LPS O-acetylase OafA/YrhL
MATERIEFANSLRGFAALSVVVSHIVGGVWFGRPAVERVTGLPQLPAEIQAPWWAYIAHQPDFNFGAFGVGIFFLISGFVIPFSLTRMSAGRFLVARVIRLFPTYAACFTLVISSVALGALYFGVVYPYKATEVIYHYFPGLRAIMASRGIDGVTWTLEVEILFYLLCAAAAPLLRTRSLWLFLMPPLITGLYLVLQALPYVPSNVLGIAERIPYVNFLFIGAAFHFVHVKAVDWRTGSLIGAGLLAVWVIGWSVAREPSLSYVWPDYLYALGLFALCYNFPRIVPKGRIVRFFADISYPLYLMHAVLGYVVSLVLLTRGYSPGVVAAAALLCAVAAATVVHILVERPTHRMAVSVQKRQVVTALMTA